MPEAREVTDLAVPVLNDPISEGPSLQALAGHLRKRTAHRDRLAEKLAALEAAKLEGKDEKGAVEEHRAALQSVEAEIATIRTERMPAVASAMLDRNYRTARVENAKAAHASRSRASLETGLRHLLLAVAAFEGAGIFDAAASLPDSPSREEVAVYLDANLAAVRAHRLRGIVQESDTWNAALKDALAAGLGSQKEAFLASRDEAAGAADKVARLTPDDLVAEVLAK